MPSCINHRQETLWLPCWVSVQGTILEQTAPMRQSCDNLQQSLRSAPLTEELKEEAKIVAAVYRVLIDAVNPCFRYQIVSKTIPRTSPRKENSKRSHMLHILN